MVTYSSSSGKQSGVTAYQIGATFIRVQFRGSKTYTYSYQTAGKEMVEAMKKLALSGQGLSTFISQNQPEFE
jgi:hypothetical protein